MSNKNQLLNHNERLASVIQTLQGKAAGGGSNGYEVKEGALTYTTSSGGPGEAPTYFLRADGILPTTTNIMIAYAFETCRDVVIHDLFVDRITPLAAVIDGSTYQLNAASYTVNCNGGMLAYSDYIKLENASITNTADYTFNEFRYVALTKGDA